MFMPQNGNNQGLQGPGIPFNGGMNNDVKNFPYTYYKWIQDPTSQIQGSDQSQVIKFLFKTDQYIDPQTAYLEIQIGVNAYDYLLGGAAIGALDADGCEGLALDGPTTALIDNLKIYCNGRLVEHIDGYNHIGQVIHDFNLRPEARKNRQDFGFNDNTSAENARPTVALNRGANIITGSQSSGTAGSCMVGNCTSSYFPSYAPVMYQGVTETGLGSNVTQTFATNNAFKTNTWNNYMPAITYTAGVQTSIHAGVQPALKANAAFLSHLHSGQYGVSTISGLRYDNHFQTFAMPGIHGTYALAHTPTSSLSLLGADTPGATGGAYRRRGGFANVGWEIPYSASLQNPNKDIVILPGHGTIQLYHGVPCGIYNVQTPLAATENASIAPPAGNYTFSTLKPALAQSVRTFKIPIISSFIGIAATGFSGLIDGALLGQLQFEWRLNPFAFYVTGGRQSILKTSFGNDTTPKPVDLANDLFNRKYTILKARMIFDTYHPAYTPKEAVGPFEFWANAWTLPHQVTFSNTAALQAEHQINVGVKSARLMLVRFLSEDYRTYTYCRQQFKLSGNVTSYQVKMGSLLFPVNPLLGHAGNPAVGSNSALLSQALAPNTTIIDDNQAFVDEFNNNLGSFMQLNKVQYFDNVGFALNDRIWDPRTCNHTLGADKVDGQPYIFEQVVGKAMYLTRFDNLDGFFSRTVQNSQNYDFGWNGIDTTQLRPFTLSMKTDQTNYNKNPVTMQVFFYQDVLVRYTTDGVYIEGGYLQ